MNNKGKPAIKFDEQMVQQMFQSVATFVRTNCVSLAKKSNFRYRISVETIRPLSEFLGVQQQGGTTTTTSLLSSSAAFTSPIPLRTPILYKKVASDTWSRITCNFHYYISNYAVITFGVAFIIALLNPFMILYLCILWILWTFHTFLIRNDLVIFGKNLASVITITNRKRTLYVLSCLVVAFKCYKYAKTVLAVSTVIIITHVLFRNPKHIIHDNNNNNEATATESFSEPKSIPTGKSFEDEGLTVTSSSSTFVNDNNNNNVTKEFV